MANKALLLPSNRLFNNSNIAAPGGTASLYLSGTLTPANFLDSNGTSLGATLTANGLGQLPDAYGDETVAYRLILKDSLGAELDGGDIDPFHFGLVQGVNASVAVGTTTTGAAGSSASVSNSGTASSPILNFTIPTGSQGPAGDLAKVTDRTALAAIVGATSKMTRYLTESGREGTFVFDSTNLSAQVAADPQQGVFVAPASDTTGASGAWVRKYPVGVVDPRWWGLIMGDAGGANRAANDTAISGMFTALLTLGTTITISVIPEVKWPFGIIEHSQAITPNATVKMSGHGMGHFGSGPTLVAGTVFRPYNCHGFNLGYTRSSLSDVGIQGNFTDTNTEAEYHGVYATQTPFLTNVKVYNMAGDGFNFNGQSSAGNSTDCGRMIGCEAWCNRDGISLGITGGNGDANVIHVIGGILNQNRRWGINDNGFLGNEFFAVQMATNGCNAINDGVTLGASKCVYNGYSYFAIAGQETGASTNSPSGSATDNTWWAYKQGTGTDTPTSGKPAWSSGMLVRAGGSVHSTSVTAQSTYTGCYAETDQGWAQISYPAIISGGVLATLVWAGSTGAVLTVDSAPAYINKLGAFKSTAYRGTDETFGVQIGERSASVKTLLFASTSVGAPTGHRLKYVNTTTGDIEWNYSNSFAAFNITGPNTAQQAGTGAALPHAFRPSILLVQPYVASGQTDQGRRLTIETASPASGARAQGEWALYRGSTAGLIGWTCRTAGTSGTWEAVYSGYSLGQIGYQTGAGGAVTQATSRTTGVTLNKVCGAITLVSAAGSTSWQTFTVTNSQVAATDVIQLNQKSGTDKYMLHVTNVSAGSFDVTFATTGGTTTEQPVFNFAVLKAAAA